MTRTFLALALMLPLLAAGCGRSGGDEISSTFPFDSARAMQDIEKLAQAIGPRPAGSEANASAADYIVDQFSAARFGIIRNQFTFETDPNRPAAVTSGNVAIEAITAGGSGSGRVSGPAAELPETIERDALTGKVAVSLRGGASFQEKYDVARASGAAGLIIINTDSGPVTANLGQSAAFPVVTVAGASGAVLEAATRAGQTVSVEVPEAQTAAGANIIARAPLAHACTYIAVANYDSMPGSPGANDNASGVAVLLELARQFTTMSPIPEVCFVALDARFAGGSGAAHYLDSLTTAGLPAVVLAPAGIGAGGTLTMYGETSLKLQASRIADSAKLKLTDGGAAPPATTNTAAFRALAISTLDLGRPGGAIGRDDQVSQLEPEKLQAAGQFLGELMVALSAKTTP